ncbi:MAG: hypothetical protein ACYC06_11830, partial [Ilumatobacteraceae bacterium]
DKIPELKTQHQGQSLNRTVLIALMGLAVTAVTAYLLIPRSQLEGRTVLASLITPNTVPDYGPPPSRCFIDGFAEWDVLTPYGCATNGGQWTQLTWSIDEGALPSEAGEVVSADFGKFLPFFAIITGVVGTYIYISSRPKKRSAD